MRRLGAKLTLNRETVRELTSSEMQRAFGASTNIGCPPTGGSCPKTACSPSCPGYICQQTEGGNTCGGTQCNTDFACPTMVQAQC
jgi:hypothetical protein